MNLKPFIVGDTFILVLCFAIGIYSLYADELPQVTSACYTVALLNVIKSSCEIFILICTDMSLHTRRLRFLMWIINIEAAFPTIYIVTQLLRGVLLSTNVFIHIVLLCTAVISSILVLYLTVQILQIWFDNDAVYS